MEQATTLTDESEGLLAALEDADVKTLLMVLVHITKDEQMLREISPYITGAWDFMHEIPEDLQRRIRTTLARVLRERGSTDVSAPAPELVHRMMETCVGQKVPSEYVPMILERFAFTDRPAAAEDGSDGRAGKNRATGMKVIVIGAGMSGICASVRLAESGIDHVVIEKNGDVGGTWHDNDYPGAGVDTPNHVYCYSFEPNHDWPEYFSKRDQLFDYFRGVARKHGVYERTRFRTEAIAAVYDEETHVWSVTIRDESGRTETLTANFVIFGVGLLNRPAVPSIPGLDSFKGPVLHTASWDTRVALAGKTVGMIGTGASGMQVGPTIAPEVEKLIIFQRSPHWVASNPNYHRAVTQGKKWALKNIPYYAEWYRFQLFWASSDSIHSTLFVDPEWPTPDISLNSANEKQRIELTKSIERQIGDNPELMKKVVPTYPPYGKRMLRDNHWYETLIRKNVDLVTEPIDHISDGKIATKTREYPVDVIVLATGFSVGRVLGPMPIHGKDGVEIGDIWGEDDPRAYLGITVPRFPNMFILYGPNTNLAHGGTAVFHTECQVEYALQGIQTLINSGLSEIECRQSVHDDYNARVDEAHSRMVWAHGGVSSWYKNKAGRVFATTPWRLVDYWNFTKRLNPADYELK